MTTELPADPGAEQVAPVPVVQWRGQYDRKEPEDEQTAAAEGPAPSGPGGPPAAVRS